ncbi:DNA-methyltransferase [Candidatus Poriferisodalis sp.]|uniref:DNA-methyltransferase n=1 Tax=Candidatus Poriferisodalis sp. TaxID=3101277 RepID=UPI003B016837
MTDASAVRSALGEPYYETDGILLYQGDCIDLLAALPDESIDLTVTSPPYNIGKEYERPLALEDYLEWCGKWMAEVYSVTRTTGAFWLNLGYVPVEGRGKAVPLPYLLWNASPFFFLQEVVWHYGAGVSARRSLSPRNEKFLWYVKDPSNYTFNLDAIRDPNVKYPNQKKNGKLKCNPLGKNPTDVWSIPKVTSGRNRSSTERTPHPAQFPEAVIERVVKGSSNPGDLILDPFVGSGTLTLVAHRLDRLAVGFDVRSDYLDIAVSRIEQSQSAGTKLSLELF